MVRGGSVYIITNYQNTTLYTGVTSDLRSRIQEHKAGKHINSFSRRYKLKKLVCHENYHSIEEAIAREKFIKGKSRQWKLDLIEDSNPTWKDLWNDIKDW